MRPFSKWPWWNCSLVSLKRCRAVVLAGVVSVACIVAAVESFRRSAGLEPAELPDPEFGEATGKVPETLERLADVQDEEVDRAVIMLTALVEPVLMVALALGVGTVVIALFLPMIDLIRALSGG
jgi:uncharacterized membrane protein YphA (DoxX/SURF4 family)